ncbi:hypothetical protein B0H14DRAFT_3469879 [Mycena olivaceomarginata]|nr:hypothetical protein B0H14DRAFT_3469879 [Mycena olivaceomarginata]
MSKGDFKLVVTLHPQLAKFIHGVLALAIDYTFKGIEGDMDEWEVVGFSERFKCRIPFASFYCDRKTKPAFEQLFIELFDAVYRVTGDKFHLRLFYPDANCRVFVMDGEVAQVQGFSEFLAQYNSPSISGIIEGNSLEYVAYCLKTCVVHFQHHCDDLHRVDKVPLEVVTELRKILGAKDQAAVDKWHRYCAIQTDTAVKIQIGMLKSLQIPGTLPSISPFLSKIAPNDYNLTPNTTNLAESAHAGTNAQTSTQLALLPGILRKYTCDNVQVDEIHQFIRNGGMRKRWNGPSEREKLSAQCKGWAAKAVFERHEHLIAFNELSQEREEGQEEWKFSLSRQKAIQREIEELQEQLKVDRRREDLKTEVKVLRLEIDAERQNRRDWVSRRGEIDAKLRELRNGPFKGVQIQGRPAPIVSNSDTPISASTDNSNDTTILDTYTDGLHPGFELDLELEPNYEVFNDNTLQMDDTDPGFGFNFGLGSTPPAYSDIDVLQIIAAPVTLPSASVPDPAVLTPAATTPAVRRRRRQSVDENDIVEGIRQRTRSKRARAIPHFRRISPKMKPSNFFVPFP